MASEPTAITFILDGEPPLATRGAGPAAPVLALMPELGGSIKHSVRVGGTRSAGQPVKVQAVPGQDVVVLQLARGPTLVLHPETARDLLLAQTAAKRTSAGLATEVRIPDQLHWQAIQQLSSPPSAGGATRGLGSMAKAGAQVLAGGFGNVAVSAVQILSDVLKDKLADLTAEQLVARVDAQVNEGVYALQAGSIERLNGEGRQVLGTLPPGPADAPLLVLMHGTFSNTYGTFHKLWDSHPGLVQTLFNHYGGRVYALDHATLGRSPIENALTLARALPAGAHLHLLTHSRGGLVAEVLARVCAQAEPDEASLAFFAPDKAPARQRAALLELSRLVKDKGISVGRILRVACPARGTLLASKRLDAFLSVFKWTLELAQLPVLPELVDFLGAVAQRREDPALIPGLAAQVPDSPLVQWLHAAPDPLPGQLRVVAGDLQADSISSWLKTLLADAFFWTDNDLVVQTRSMYGGPTRKLDASYLLASGGQVSHFSYFENELSAEGIVSGLTEDAPQRFQTIGRMSAAGLASEGFRGAQGAADDKAASSKPAVFVLPGILGSNLAVNGQRIWLGPRLFDGLKRIAYAPGDGVAPDGPVGRTYDELSSYLSASHEVIPFGFDWRKPIEEEARRLGAEIGKRLDARNASGQPVRLIAHSMGGLLARAVQLECPQVWDRLMAHPAARLLMLGTPNAGSWAPMQVLSGDDTFGNFLVDVGAPLQDHAARQMMAQFPGFLQLQADLPNLADSKAWAKLAADDLAAVQQHNFWHVDDGGQLNVYRWGVPEQGVLDQALSLRKRLDGQLAEALPKVRDKLCLVVGQAPKTPVGYLFDDTGLDYQYAADSGDGRVPLDSALLPGVRTWQLACVHGDLASQAAAFPAFVELLETGSTSLLAPLAQDGASRGAASAAGLTLGRPSRMRLAASAPAALEDLQRLMPHEEPPVPPPSASSSLRVTVLNGDLRFVRQALLLGHYRSMTLSGTEFAIDRLIGGTMKESLAIGRYPDLPGTLQIFANTALQPANPLQMPRPASVIVVGLGPEGGLRGSDLVYTVRQGVIAWAQKVFEQEDSPASFSLAATLIGSGGTGVSAGQAAQWIVQGVIEANARLADRRHSARAWPLVEQLQLIEQYLDRASEAWRALQAQAEAMEFRVDPVVNSVTGALRRPPDSGYRGASYDLISALAVDDGRGNTSVAYTLDTKRARSEMQAQRAQVPLVRELVRQGSNDRKQDPQIGRTLFNLLVPAELGTYLAGTSEMLIELNPGSAGIPWEMLDTQDRDRAGADTRPWAIRAKLLRKLRLEDYRQTVRDAGADDDVLIIGEPWVDTPGYPRLSGARKEANAVLACLSEPSGLGREAVHALISPDDERLAGPDATQVINKLMERDWRIIHIAGHGEPPSSTDPRGVVLSGQIFLGSREIAALPVVPELVFVNCCHLAAREPGQLLMADGKAAPIDRAQFAASVAEALIRIGVRCVVAAGWAVQDEAAMAFAGGFYKALMQGRRFMDAVALARDAAHALGGNTWAAYQCYGDPDWTFRRAGSDARNLASAPTPSLTEQFSGIASAPGLALALETLAIQSSLDDASPKDKAAAQEGVRTRLRYLGERFGSTWGDVGAVAEAFGYAWDRAGDRAQAIGWYQRAVAAHDGSASFKAIEQLGNLQVRAAEAAIKGREKSAGKAVHEADLKALQAAISSLARLADLQPTMERLSLVGSAWKRMAMAAGTLRLRAPLLREAIANAVRCYGAAEALGRRDRQDWFYPAMNGLVARLAQGRREIDPALLAELRQTLFMKNRDDPDFWSVAGLTELGLFEALAEGRLAQEQAEILKGFADLRERVSATALWDSVFKQAEFLQGHAMRGVKAPAEADALKKIVAVLRGYATAGKG